MSVLLSGEADGVDQYWIDRYVVVTAHDDGHRVSAVADVFEREFLGRAVNDVRIAGGDRARPLNEHVGIFVEEVVQVIIVEFLGLWPRHERRTGVIHADFDCAQADRATRGRAEDFERRARWRRRPGGHCRVRRLWRGG